MPRLSVGSEGSFSLGRCRPQNRPTLTLGRSANPNPNPNRSLRSPGHRDVVFGMLSSFFFRMIDVPDKVRKFTGLLPNKLGLGLGLGLGVCLGPELGSARLASCSSSTDPVQPQAPRCWSRWRASWRCSLTTHCMPSNRLQASSILKQG